MCLNKITERQNIPNEGYGYKVFMQKENDDKLYGDFFSTQEERPVHKWLQSRPFPHAIYPTGWHVFENKQDAFLYCTDSNKDLKEDYCFFRFLHSFEPGDIIKATIRRVRYRTILATGLQNDYSVFSVKEIYIYPDEVNGEENGHK